MLKGRISGKYLNEMTLNTIIKTNQSLRIRKFAIRTAHYLPEISSSSAFCRICKLHTTYANYFHSDGKLSIKYNRHTAKMLVNCICLICLPGIYTNETCRWMALAADLPQKVG